MFVYKLVKYMMNRQANQSVFHFGGSITLYAKVLDENEQEKWTNMAFFF